MIEIGLGHYLSLGAIIFFLGVIGIFLNRKNKSIELSLLFSIPASVGLVIAAEEIVSALFGYGSFTTKDIEMTSMALTFFGYGVVAFALIKILANFFFARNNTKTPFYISTFVVMLNILISVIFFNSLGFLIIPIATSISTWVGIIVYMYLLKNEHILILQKKLYYNTFKILISSIIMFFVLELGLEKYSNYLEYEYTYKSVYLISIVGFAGAVYLLSCYLFGLLKIKNYKTN